MSEDWAVVDPNQNVRNTFVHFQTTDGRDERGGSLSDSELLASEPAARGRRTPSPAPASSAAPADSDPPRGEEQRRGARPGRRERRQMREEAQGSHEGSSRSVRSIPGSDRILLAIFAVICCCAFVVIFGLAFRSKDHEFYTMPEKVMTEHSVRLLKESPVANKASLAALEDKLQLKSMHIELDTQVFKGSRTAAKDIITAMCFLPERVCKVLEAGVSLGDWKYHKKKTEPLNDNQGSYYSVGMWVQETGHDDQVQVAFMASSMTFQLRDVVTYRDQIHEEPVIECTDQVQSHWFGTDRRKNCREISKKKTITQLPVFKQAVMSPEEMQLVDDMMEAVLAKKVLTNTNHRVPLVGGRSGEVGSNDSDEF